MLGLLVNIFSGCGGYDGTRPSDKPYNAYNYDSHYRGGIYNHHRAYRYGRVPRR